jgi:cytoskeleton protein RodZ
MSEETTASSRETELGTLLRERREAKRLSLNEVSAQTRLDVHIIEHLERGELDVPPGAVFLRGFLRTYTRFLNIETETLARYSSLLDVSTAEEPLLSPRAEAEKRSSEEPAKPFNRWLLTLFVLVAGGLLIWSQESALLEERPAETVESEATTPVTPPQTEVAREAEPVRLEPTTAPAPIASEVAQGTATGRSLPKPATVAEPPAAEPEPPAMAVVEPPVAPEQASVAETPSSASQATKPAASRPNLALSIVASAPVWISVQADEQPPELLKLQAQESRAWESAKELYVLTVGDASALTVKLNGQSVEPPTASQLQTNWRLSASSSAE